jgi:outer membrane protein assembly factor BamB
LKALEADKGDFERDNANSAAVWHYQGSNPEEFETTMHRTMGSVAIKNDLLFVADHSGVIHCVDAKSGTAHWTYDMLSESWGSPMIVNDKVYISNAEGMILIFELSKEPQTSPIEMDMGTSVLTSPVAANNTLFVANRNRLYAIEEGAKSEPPAE